MQGAAGAGLKGERASGPSGPEHAVSSSLDPPETNSQWQGIDLPFDEWTHPDSPIEPIDRRELLYHHGHWRQRRLQVWKILAAANANQNRRRRFRECGSLMRLHLLPDTNELALTFFSCHDRFCEPCQRRRVRALRPRLKQLCQRGPCRFITLTLRHSPTPLADQLKRLYSSFAMLRRRDLWKDAVTGGAAILELKLSSKDGLWHPHLHVLAEGRWMDHKQLSATWHAITGDSCIVDIRQISGESPAVHYVTKYVTKTMHDEVFTDTEKAVEAVQALKGKRTLITFGRWRETELEKSTEAMPANAVDLGSIRSLLDRVAMGDEEAKRWIQAAERKWPGLISGERNHHRPKEQPP